MEIITRLPTFDDGTINRAIEREIRTGIEFIKAKEAEEERIAAAQAYEWKGVRAIKGLGKAVAFFPPDEYHRLIKKFGKKEVMSKDFLRFYRRKFPDLCPNRT